jgi:hypothetical protein
MIQARFQRGTSGQLFHDARMNYASGMLWSSRAVKKKFDTEKASHTPVTLEFLGRVGLRSSAGALRRGFLP